MVTIKTYDDVVQYFTNHFNKDTQKMETDMVIAHYSNIFKKWLGCYFAIPIKHIPTEFLNQLLDGDKDFPYTFNTSITSIQVSNGLLILGYSTIDCLSYEKYTEEQAIVQLYELKKEFETKINLI